MTLQIKTTSPVNKDQIDVCLPNSGLYTQVPLSLYIIDLFLSLMQTHVDFNPFPHTDAFWHLQQTTLENIVTKGEIAHNEQFPFCHHVFNTIRLLYFHIFAKMITKLYAAEILYVGKS